MPLAGLKLSKICREVKFFTAEMTFQHQAVQLYLPSLPSQIEPDFPRHPVGQVDLLYLPDAGGEGLGTPVVLFPEGCHAAGVVEFDHIGMIEAGLDGRRKIAGQGDIGEELPDQQEQEQRRGYLPQRMGPVDLHWVRMGGRSM